MNPEERFVLNKWKISKSKKKYLFTTQKYGLYNNSNASFVGKKGTMKKSGYCHLIC
jgi:hypothetical protein